ncbi:DUF4238 domain-containing protein [Mycobacterium botniense]|uniref:DUF4238 domain-containing protein n=1 Tax=Mycobacterium botniense TaxID=84962 RepID=A0A7I9XT94_9MYCO|nr:DUF4238 domain-containing protein [Mycobacterium botniense]GFG73231.1 hypothetical protein MBOT_05960 [Mycobacterium botniense]
MAQISRAHHTVPRFYLSGFADDRQFVGVVRLPGNARYRQSVGKVSVINDFYTVNSAAERDVIEKLIADQIEAPAAEIFRKVLVDQVWPLDEAERAILATFLALQHARGSNKRRALDEIAKTIANTLGDSSGFDISAVDWPEKLKAAHITSMLDFGQTGPCFYLRPWTLIRFNRKRLLTCDTPISLHPFPNAPAGSAVGTGTAWRITFPMSRTTGLAMLGHLIGSEAEAAEIASGRLDSVERGTAALAKDFNDATLHNARECVYHHPEDGGLVPTQLPEPRANEIVTGHPAVTQQRPL